MNKKLLIGIGIAATVVAAYFIFKPKKPDNPFVSNGDDDNPLPDPKVDFKCVFPEMPCPNNKLKCFNPLVFGQNQCNAILS